MCSIGCENCPIFDTESFETGFGNWNAGGIDSYRSTYHAHTGVYSVILRDNSGVGSSIYTTQYDFSNVISVDIEFSFKAFSMEPGEDFFLEYSLDGGTNYIIAETWTSGSEFQNYIRYFETAKISLRFSESTRFRIRCDASSNTDLIYLDDVSISTCTTNSTSSLSDASEDEYMTIENRAIQDLVIWPNPVSNTSTLKIRVPDDQLSYNIQILDTAGKLITQHQIIDVDETSIELSNLPVGLYYLRCTSENDSFIKQF